MNNALRIVKIAKKRLEDLENQRKQNQPNEKPKREEPKPKKTKTCFKK